MNLAALIVTATLALPVASAQTTAATPHTGTHPHPHTAATKAATAPAPAEASGPELPPGVPSADGKVETAYALTYIDTKIGEGELATPNQFYTVHYTGWLASDGAKFDSSVDRGEPITFPQGAHQVIPGWDTGFAGMHIGGKRRLFIPYQLAYGDRGRPPVIPAKSDLIFDIELIAVSATPPAPPSAPPAPASSQTPQSTQKHPE